MVCFWLVGFEFIALMFLGCLEFDLGCLFVGVFGFVYLSVGCLCWFPVKMFDLLSWFGCLFGLLIVFCWLRVLVCFFSLCLFYGCYWNCVICICVSRVCMCGVSWLIVDVFIL